MSEGRKRSRKSKLEVRSDDIEGTEIIVLEKATLPTFLKPKNKILDHTYSLQDASNPAPLSSIQLSVKVEVEEFDESIMNVDKDDHSIATIKPGPYSQLNSVRRPRTTSRIRVFQVDLDKMFKITDHIIWSSINPADKYLSIEMRNIWGRVLKPEENEDPYNELIQAALQSWGLGLINGRVWRESPIFYQCHICKLAWWYLEPFREHIRSHDHETLKVYHQENYQESIIIAGKELCEKTLYIRCEGNCYRCGRSFDSHIKTNTHVYTCLECNETLATCSMLKHHQPVCFNKQLIQFPKSQKCQVCYTQFLNIQDLEKHMTTAHQVRSDLPSPFSLKTCSVCRKRYHLFFTHMCSKSSMNSVCSHCYRRFPTKALADFHMVMGETNYRCKLCNTVLPKKCMETEHMLSHTDKFRMAYKCINPKCPPTLLFPDEKSVRLHKALSHQKRFDRRRAYYELVLVPAKCVKTTIQELDKFPAYKGTKAGKDLKALDSPTPNEDVDMDIIRTPADEQSDKEILQENMDIKQEMQSFAAPDTADNDSQDYEHMGYEQMLSKVFKVSDSVLHSQSFVRSVETEPMQIKTEPGEEINFEDLIDIEENPIKIKEEPLEIEGQVDIDESCDIGEMLGIKTEPLDYGIGLYKDSITAVKMEPEEVKKELIEATDMKIMDTHSESPKVEPPISQITPKMKPANILVRTYSNKKSLLKKKSLVVKQNNLKTIIKTENNPNTFTYRMNLKTNSLRNSTTLQPGLTNSTTLEPNNITDEVAQSNTTENGPDSLSKELTEKMITLPPDSSTERKVKQHAFLDKIKPNGSIEKTVLQRKLLALKKTLQPKNPRKRNVDQHGFRERRIYTCSKCGYANRHKLYRIHMNSNCDLSSSSMDVDKYMCTKCGISFSTLKMYLVHFHKHGYESLHCPSCNIQFEFLKDLLPHFHKHVRQNFVNYWMINKKLEVPTKRQHRCQICRKTVDPEDFFRHWESHLKLKTAIKTEPESSENSPERAPIVNPKALQPNVLRMALEQLLSLLKEKECYVCLRVFSRRNDCKRHLIEHLLLDAYTRKPTTPGWSFRCQICQEDFSRAEQYKFHMREHGALPVYRCDLCDKTFSDSSNFAKHKKIHSLKVLICDICKKKFHAKSSLEKHMIMHMMSEPIKCHLCPKLFYTTSQYNKHVKVSHDRVSKFKCILCDVYFDSLKKKWDHAWVSHNERKHKADCPMCGKGFRKYLDVKLHAQDVHKVDLSFLNIKTVAKAVSKLKRFRNVKSIKKELVDRPLDSDDSQESTTSLEQPETSKSVTSMEQPVTSMKETVTPTEQIIIKVEPSEDLEELL